LRYAGAGETTMLRTTTALTALLWASTATAQTPVPVPGSQDFDIACLVATSGGLNSLSKDSANYNGVYRALWFYLGRLTVRSDDTPWMTVLKGRASEPGAAAGASAIFPQCLKFSTSKLLQASKS
jgi:hypothetical protein